MIRLTLISSWAVLLLVGCEFQTSSGPLAREAAEECFRSGGSSFSFHTGCIYNKSGSK